MATSPQYRQAAPYAGGGSPWAALVLLLGLDGVSGTSHCYLLGEEAWASGSAKWDLGGIMVSPFAALNQRLLTGPANLFTSVLGRLWP